MCSELGVQDVELTLSTQGVASDLDHDASARSVLRLSTAAYRIWMNFSWNNIYGDTCWWTPRKYVCVSTIDVHRDGPSLTCTAMRG